MSEEIKRLSQIISETPTDKTAAEALLVEFKRHQMVRIPCLIPIYYEDLCPDIYLMKFDPLTKVSSIGVSNFRLEIRKDLPPEDPPIVWIVNKTPGNEHFGTSIFYLKVDKLKGFDGATLCLISETVSTSRLDYDLDNPESPIFIRVMVNPKRVWEYQFPKNKIMYKIIAF